jgi:phospholipase/carboxylesterase
MGDYVYRERQGVTPEAPLLVLLHGTGGDENQFFELGQHLLAGARLVAPRGDVSEGGALRYFRRKAEGVYDMADLARASDKLAAFVAARRAEGKAERVFGFGYSNGANVLASVLFNHPELFDGAVLLHPLIPFTPPPAPGLAGRHILITAGRRDPIAPASETQRLTDYFGAQGSDVNLVWHDGGHEIGREEIAAAEALLAGKPFA